MQHVIDQSTLNFVESQLTHVEAEVYRTKYANIQYPELIPVDTSMAAWAKTVTFYSMDSVGSAKWMSGQGTDFPTVDFSKEQFESSVHMAGIGFEYQLEEVMQAQMLGISLSAEGGISARRAYEEFLDISLLNGRPEKGMEGLTNYTGITTVAAPNGAGGFATFVSKTPDEIILDINNLLAGVWIDSLNIEICDTLLIDELTYLELAGKRLSADSETTVLEYIMAKNVLKSRFNRDLTIRVVRGLETAGVGNTRRIVAYRRSPEVLKAHLPMPLQFLPMEQRLMQFITPGIFRFGGLDIRLPASVRYLDGV